MTTERTAVHLTRSAASTTQTGPRANVIAWPDMVVNVAPAGFQKLGPARLGAGGTG